MGLSKWDNSSWYDDINSSSFSCRTISKTGTSGGATLYACDTSNIITVAQGTTLVAFKTSTAQISGDNVGLTTQSSFSSYSAITWMSSAGVYARTSLYSALDLTDGYSNAVVSGKDAYYKVFGIFTAQDSPLISRVYGTAYGDAQRDGNYFNAAYAKKSSSQGGWAIMNEVQSNSTYAAITCGYGKYENNWQHFQYTFYSGFEYVVTLHVYCASNVYEGIVTYSHTQSVDPNSNNSIDALGGMSAYSVKGNENYGVKTFTYAPSSNTTLHFYFRTTEKANYYGMRYAYIKIIQKVKVCIDANGGGSGTVYQNFMPYSINTGVVVTPPTRIGQNSIPYTFLGFFASTGYGGGSKLLDSQGKFPSDNTDKVLLGAGNDITHLYANWGNTISYNTLTSPRTLYCTTAAASATTTTGNPACSVADNPVRCASGQSVSISYTNYYNRFFQTSNAQYLYASNGLATGTYSPGTIYFSSPSKAEGSGTYQSMSYYKTLPSIKVTAVALSSYGTPTTPSVSQKATLPAWSTSGNLSTYFSGYGSTQTITYTNGATRNGAITYSFGGSYPGLGTSFYPSATTHSFGNSMYCVATGESSKQSTKKYITTADCAANIVTNIDLFTPVGSESRPSTFYFDVSSSATFVGIIFARYTSGEERDVLNNGNNATLNYGTCVSVAIVSGFDASAFYNQ